MNDILKKIKSLTASLFAAVALVAIAFPAAAQFTPGQILTASGLNAALAAKTTNASSAITGGTITGLSSPLPVASGGTGATSLGAFALLSGATFTGASGLSYSNSAFTINDSSGAAKAQVIYSNAGSIAWAWDNVSASSNKFALDRYVSGSYVDSPFSVANATGIVTMPDGIANTPISGSTGSFTTLSSSGIASLGTGSTIATSPTRGDSSSKAATTFFVQDTLLNPPAIGSGTAAGGSFTTLSASSTVSGTGFSTYLASPPAIGGTAAAAGSFTTLTASSTVSGAGFTTLLSPYALLASPTFTGTLAASAITASSTITPSQTSGIVGTTTNNSANAGSVGEFISSNVASGSAVALTSGTTANITSIPLTAGDWDIYGFVGIVTGGSTVVTSEQGGLSATTATLPTLGSGGAQFFHPLTLPTGQGMYESVGAVRVTLASSATIFLVANFAFSTSTCSAYGFVGARRRR